MTDISDLNAKKVAELREIAKNLGIEGASTLKKKEIIETFDGSESSFKNWRKFHSENKNLFFNLGPENNWEKILDLKTQKEIEANFKNEMSKLKYV